MKMKMEIPYFGEVTNQGQYDAQGRSKASRP